MPFLLSFLASISTLIGIIPIYIKRSKNIIICALGFASGVMISVSLFDLIKESFILFNLKYNYIGTILFILLFLNIGIIISKGIDYIIPSNNKLYRVGVVSMLAIIMHNIPEGIATYITTQNSIELGITLTLAIAAHNIPEGITIALPIYYSTNKKRRAVIYTFISGFSEFIGAIIAFLFLKPSNIGLGVIYSIIAGIMLYIALFELLPLSYKYNKHYLTLISFVIGMSITLLI